MSKILIQDIYLNYDIYGFGTPILFLHGAYLSVKEWQYQADYFSKDHQVILLDMPGHGSSDNLPEYTAEIIASYISKFIEVMKIKPCIICGHSLGGMIAQSIAINSPDSVKKIILADTSYGVKTTAAESALTSLTMPMINYMKVDKQAKLYANQMGKLHAEVYNYVYNDIKKHEKDPANYKNIWKAVVNFNSKDKLHNISCPTLILAGALNTQTHKQAKYMKQMIPDSKLIFIKDAEHMCNMDNPKEFNKVIEEFIK